MILSLGRRLYNLGRKSGPKATAQRPMRPAGPLAWLHVPSPASSGALAELARRLIDEDGVTVLVTSQEALSLPEGTILEAPPEDSPLEAQVFLDHWRPDIAIFADGELRPVLIETAAARKLPLLMVDARQPRFTEGRQGWFPGLMRESLAPFIKILAVDEPAAKAFKKAGALPEALKLGGRMEEPSSALPALEAEREALAQLTTARPIWFAASVPEAEEASVFAAHREALGLAHRLLLIFLPEVPARADEIAARLEGEDWMVAARNAEEEPEAETEIFVVGDAAELGLWYRLAPISFLGGSLAGTGAIRSPLEPAALGSAILHGPRPGAHGPALGRLGAARAARAVASTADLAEALGDLLSPDRAARLAQAAWNISSEGAEVTEEVMALIRDIMDGTA